MKIKSTNIFTQTSITTTNEFTWTNRTSTDIFNRTDVFITYRFTCTNKASTNGFTWSNILSQMTLPGRTELALATSIMELKFAEPTAF